METDIKAVYHRVTMKESRFGEIFRSLNNVGKYDNEGKINLNSFNINKIVSTLMILVLSANQEALNSDFMVRKLSWIFGLWLVGSLYLV